MILSPAFPLVRFPFVVVVVSSVRLLLEAVAASRYLFGVVSLVDLWLPGVFTPVASYVFSLPTPPPLHLLFFCSFGDPFFSVLWFGLPDTSPLLLVLPLYMSFTTLYTPGRVICLICSSPGCYNTIALTRVLNSAVLSAVYPSRSLSLSSCPTDCRQCTASASYLLSHPHTLTLTSVMIRHSSFVLSAWIYSRSYSFCWLIPSAPFLVVKNCSSVFVSLCLSVGLVLSALYLSSSSLRFCSRPFTSRHLYPYAQSTQLSIFSSAILHLFPPPPVFHRPVAPLTVPAVVPLRSRSNVCHLLALSLAFPPTVYASVLALFIAPLSLCLISSLLLPSLLPSLLRHTLPSSSPLPHENVPTFTRQAVLLGRLLSLVGYVAWCFQLFLFVFAVVVVVVVYDNGFLIAFDLPG